MLLYTFSNGEAAVEYSPEHHTLYINGQPTAKEFFTAEDFEEHGNRANKSNRPSIIRISMGNACNMGCSYCLQEPLSTGKNKQSNNAEVTIQHLRNLDLSELEEIQLWGGEPFLYWRYIKTFVEQLGFKGKYAIVTNGTKMTLDHIKWMMDTGNEWVIAMSHDGLQHNLLRGEDFLQNPKTREAMDYLISHPRFNKTFHLAFNSVITDANWDVHATVRFFHRIYPTVPVNFELMTIYDPVSERYALDKNLKRHQEAIESLISASRRRDKDIGHNSMYHFGMGSQKVGQAFRQHDVNQDRFGCGVANEKILTIGHKGEMIACQNTYGDPDKVYGHIDTYDAARLDTVMNIDKKRSCVTCPVQRLCKQTCPLLERESSYDRKNCNIRYHHYLQILESTITGIFRQETPMKIKR